jgi:hypothetical protein
MSGGGVSVRQGRRKTLDRQDKRPRLNIKMTKRRSVKAAGRFSIQRTNVL